MLMSLNQKSQKTRTLECADEDFFDFEIDDSFIADLPDDDFYINEDSLLEHGAGE